MGSSAGGRLAMRSHVRDEVVAVAVLLGLVPVVLGAGTTPAVALSGKLWCPS
jgi:hypothetical protein